jgi:hypothetical protein
MNFQYDSKWRDVLDRMASFKPGANEYFRTNSDYDDFAQLFCDFFNASPEMLIAGGMSLPFSSNFYLVFILGSKLFSSQQLPIKTFFYWQLYCCSFFVKQLFNSN